MIITATYRYIKGRRTRKTEETGPRGAKPCRHASPNLDNTDGALSAQGVCQQCRKEKRARRVYRTKIICGQILPYALMSLDVTIIASALPSIAADFGELAQLNWIVSAFNLTSAAFIPFWGQMADIFGRHAALQAATALMLAGSALCTGAPAPGGFGPFLLGRAVQGAGCAGIGVVVRTVLADRVPLREYARVWALFALVGGAAYALGPVLGGYLTAAHWRWCFALNLPVALAAMVVVFVVLRPELLGPRPLPVGPDDDDDADDEDCRRGRSRRRRLVRRLAALDYGGQALCLSGFTLLILALTWAGATYAWDSAAVLVSLVLGVLLTAGFVYYEYLMDPSRALGRRFTHQTPMLPFALLGDRNMALLFYVHFATGMAMYAVLYFMDLYFSLVAGHDAAAAGVQLIYYTPGLGAGVALAVVFSNAWPRQTFPPLLLGSVVEAVGVGLLAWALGAGDGDRRPVVYAMMALAGAGTGLRFQPGSLHALGFFPGHVAQVTALMALAVPFGGTLALTLMSTVFNNVAGLAGGASSSDAAATTVAASRAGTDSVRHAIAWAFVAITPFMVLSVLASACLGNVHVRAHDDDEDDDDREGHGAGAATGAVRSDAHLVRGSYLLLLLRRRPAPGDGAAEQGSHLPDTEVYPLVPPAVGAPAVRNDAV